MSETNPFKTRIDEMLADPELSPEGLLTLIRATRMLDGDTE